MIVILILLSYLIGSIPTAYIFGRVLRGIDIRKFGSGNVGATNAFRVLGVIPGIFVLVIDFFKGFFCVTFLIDFFDSLSLLKTSLTVRILSGFTSVLGHNWPVFLKLKGGKGIATTFGVLVGLASKIPNLRIVLGLVLLCWITIFLTTGFVSLASILGSVILVILMLFFPQPTQIFLLGLILCFLVIIRHKHNIIRLLQKKESKTKIF